tara:strand:+ start:702 stop:1472 length:771 start_codon:yes stop_codon:yes gene_type:complete
MCRDNYSLTKVRTIAKGGLEVWLSTRVGVLEHNVEIISRTLWVILSRVKNLDGYFHSMDVSNSVFHTWDIPHGAPGYYTRQGKRSFTGMMHLYGGLLQILTPKYHNRRNFCWKLKPGFIQELKDLGYIFVEDIAQDEEEVEATEEAYPIEYLQVVPPAHPEVEEVPEAPTIAFTERRYVTVSFGGDTYEDVLQHEPLCHLGAAIIQANDRENQITEAGLTMLQLPNVREAMLMAGLNSLSNEEDREAVLRELLAEQ